MTLITVDDSHWYVMERGVQTSPPLLLLHGFTGCAEVWDHVVTGLMDEFRCITVDLPGHGKTVVPDRVEMFALTAVADGVAAVLDAMRIESTHVWGYSMGGRLALQFAQRHPTRVTRLVLESASPGIALASDREERRRSDDMLAEQILRDGVPAFVEEWLAKPLFAAQAKMPQAIQARARELRLRNTAEGLALSLRGMGTGAQEPLHDQLADLKIPTLIMAGENDAKFTAIGQMMHGALPNSQFALIPGSGHSPHWECPEIATATVRSFLRETG